MISTGLTSHQIAPVLTKLSSTTWLWFGVGTNKGAFGGFGMPGIPASRTERSTEEACIVQVPGTGLLGSGHCVETRGLVFQASGTNPKSLTNAAPKAGPQSSPDRKKGHAIASFGSLLPLTENIGIRTYKCAVCLMSPPVGSCVGS